MGYCHQAQKEKELRGALSAAKSALDVCPDSQEASQLVTTVRNDQSKAREHLKSAKDHLAKACFDEARQDIRSATKLWASLEGLKETETRIGSVSLEFASLMKTATNALKHSRFPEASSYCAQALRLCPHSAEAKSMESEITRTERQRKEQRKHAKEMAVSTGKWTACIFAVGAVLVLLAVIAIGFWRWVTGTVCPWVVSNQTDLVILCCVLSGLQGLIHAGRTTNTWVQAGGGVFLGPLLVTGVIVLISVGIAVYSYDAPWQSGTAVGLAIGVLVCGLSIFFSCIDD